MAKRKEKIEIGKAGKVPRGRPILFPELDLLKVGECGIMRGVGELVVFRAKNHAKRLRKTHGWQMSVFVDRKEEVVRIVRRS